MARGPSIPSALAGSMTRVVRTGVRHWASRQLDARLVQKGQSFRSIPGQACLAAGLSRILSWHRPTRGLESPANDQTRRSSQPATTERKRR